MLFHALFSYLLLQPVGGNPILRVYQRHLATLPPWGGPGTALWDTCREVPSLMHPHLGSELLSHRTALAREHGTVDNRSLCPGRHSLHTARRSQGIQFVMVNFVSTWRVFVDEINMKTVNSG